MATPKQVSPWIRQAEADLAAARVRADGIKECHQRYWIQQSCEKALKALALIHFCGSDEEDAALRTLLSHSPMRRLGEHVDDPTSKLPKSLNRKRLRLLNWVVKGFINKLDNAEFLKKIDDLEPTHKDDDPSYRYPFMEGDAYVPPMDYAEWQRLLGGLEGAVSAVQHLIRAVKDEQSTFDRRPK